MNEEFQQAKARHTHRRRSPRMRAWALAVLCCVLMLAGYGAMVHWRNPPLISPAPVAPVSVPAAITHPAGLQHPGIILHDSDSPARMNGVVMNAAHMEEVHREDHPGWATRYEGKTYHIGYHYLILPDGTIQMGRPEGCIGAHARHFNDWLGICTVGDFSGHRGWTPSVPTSKQFATVVSLCERLMSKYHIPPENVRRHCDVNDTVCPGERFPYTRIQTELRAYAAAHSATTSAISVPAAPVLHQP